MEANEVMTTETQDAKQTETKTKGGGRHLTPEEQLEAIAEKQKALAARARAVRAKINVKERKERAHRLIQAGATIEAATGATIPEKALPYLEAFFRAHRAEILAALERAENGGV